MCITSTTRYEQCCAGGVVKFWDSKNGHSACDDAYMDVQSRTTINTIPSILSTLTKVKDKEVDNDSNKNEDVADNGRKDKEVINDQQ